MYPPLSRYRPTSTGRPPSRRAFTLIELLSILGIIGLLVCLILPAVQSAREAARRVQCTSNLGQIGIALQGYHSVHGMYPSPLADRRGVGTNSLSELTFLLPHLEQTVLFNAINFDFVTQEISFFPALENHTARNTRVALFLCPSDGESNNKNSYRFNMGRHRARPGPAWEGPFNIGILPSQANVTDGLSRTAFVSERVAGNFVVGSADRVRNVMWHGRGGLSVPILSDDQYIPLCLAVPTPQWVHTSGRYWFYMDMIYSHYNHNGTPNDRRPSCGVVSGLHPPRSYHPGLVNVLFGDGHTEAVTDSIDPRAWVALGTHDAGD